MNHKDPKPGNRPPGLPGNSRFAAAGGIVGLIFITIESAAMISVYTNNPQDFFNCLEPAFLPLIGLCLLVTFLLNSGRLIFVKLFRWLAVIVTYLYAGVALLTIVQLLAYGVERALIDAVGLVVLLLLSPLLGLMWRDFKRCRWLDPKSLPHEWEIAAIHDPSSINYRGK
jgi:hypothetical protein